MNVRKLFDQLEECNEEATVSCIMQSEKDASFYETIVLRTDIVENLVDIIVMDTNGNGITVRQLKNELNGYDDSLAVCIKENKLNPKRFPYEVNGVKDEGEKVFLELPKLMAGLFKE